MNKLYYILALVLAYTMLHSCIDEYNPKGVEEMSGLLVVEGMITNDTTIIKLSKSVGIKDDITNVEAIYNANVYVESENGETFPTIEVTYPGQYSILVGELQASTKYRLKISLDGEEYESTFLTPVLTSAVDSVYAYKEERGQPIYVTVSTHNSDSETGYYLWSYEEIWEINPRINASITHTKEPIHPDYTNEFMFGYDGYFVYYDNVNGPYYNEGLRCWKYNSSNSILLGTSNKLSENRIVNLKLFDVPDSDDRFSSLYYIKLNQKALRKESFDYLSNLQKNIESTGDIFGPIPSEMKGNITCTTSPDIHVIGYVDVSTTSILEKYIPRRSYLYEAPYLDCKEILTWDSSYLPVRYEASVPPEFYFAPSTCIDCRLSPGSTKNKPDFWPN